MLVAGDVAPIRDWLRDHVHRPGRRRDTEELLRDAVGSGLDPEPFLRHLERVVA
ncbi:MAG: hypothetical protein HZB46_06535 [Solirubrobacterales bacterium]|nr:hypothetical protein [Solirubrobacterales bacterium]